MTLTRFITENSESILAEFEEFARTHTTAGEAMDIAALRDHAAGILKAIALDIGSDQSGEEQRLKSKGDAPRSIDTAPTAAEQHGTERAESGFTLPEMLAEYRALRASVLRRWVEAGNHLPGEPDIQDLIRFNEAIDQSLAESVGRFSLDLDRSREIFIAILGHDLRTPLGAVLTGSSFLVSEGELTGANLSMATRIRTSAERMKKLVGDLLDFTTARLGSRMPIHLANADIGDITREAVAEIAAQYPDRELRFFTSGDTSGQFDAQRISQAVTNLIGNAVQHGSPDTAIRVEVRRTGTDEIVVSVHNQGTTIPASEVNNIFSPFKRLQPSAAYSVTEGSMGLGLYIAEQIATGHNGRIELRSPDGDGTTFLLYLPRQT